jgi:hypothetical protein
MIRVVDHSDMRDLTNESLSNTDDSIIREKFFV